LLFKRSHTLLRDIEASTMVFVFRVRQVSLVYLEIQELKERR